MNTGFLLIGLFCIILGTAKCGIPIAKLRSPDYDSIFCRPIVIAHRGASGYVPEHTLGAYALAVTLGTDFVEPDLVMTKDGQLIARHDNELGLSTDVAQHPEYASRRRNQTVDGVEINGWFTEDFTLEEIKKLRAIERTPKLRPGNARLDGAFQVPTLQEIIDLVKGLQTSQRKIGLYSELKHSTHFQKIGLPMEQKIVDTFRRNGYFGRSAPVYIQSFEVNNLKKLKTMTNLRLLQLFDVKSAQPADQAALGTNLTYGHMATLDGLREVATYAYAVGPFKNYIIPRDDNNQLTRPTSFVQDAHDAGLKVHPYTFRAENYFLPLELQSADRKPTSFGDAKAELKAFIDIGIDGLITEQPDILVQIRSCKRKSI